MTRIKTKKQKILFTFIFCLFSIGIFTFGNFDLKADQKVNAL